MFDDLSRHLPKLAPALTMLTVALVVIRLKGLRWREDLRFVRPPGRLTAVWLVGWLAWMAIIEVVSRQLGLETPSSWSRHSPAVVALLTVGIVFLAPFAEELVFRGLLFNRLLGSRGGLAAAIVVPGLLFAMLHSQYSSVGMLMIFLDAVLLGLARHTTASLIPPILMHMMGNLVAVLQRMMG